ncbi:hypothetical protein KI387_030750 [Taxus chinensis]|uniref:Uncharacterized protein n=1 Tax=Taxus chinensis TaxID=29808 RepID=A0AA38CHT4_TAXCH|nr:hypothetical protein KI387_030750 [Taxus chinensis]
MGRSPCCSKDSSLNRGAWTAEEDLILSEYIKIHGDGGWGSLSQKAGLKRCGKSCRLRWLNYLRPGIKRGNISGDEEELIIRLHRLLGNRWSLIAGRLPGRTDNEVKNYWNTRLSKKQALPKPESAPSPGDHLPVKAKAVKITKVRNKFVGSGKLNHQSMKSIDAAQTVKIPELLIDEFIADTNSDIFENMVEWGCPSIQNNYQYCSQDFRSEGMSSGQSEQVSVLQNNMEQFESFTVADDQGIYSGTQQRHFVDDFRYSEMSRLLLSDSEEDWKENFTQF